jgi:hypothetical protein
MLLAKVLKPFVFSVLFQLFHKKDLTILSLRDRIYVTIQEKGELEMGIIYQHDKRSGNTYAYESHSFWDKEKKMSRAKRTLIGRVDPNTGDIVATDGRGRKRNMKKAEGEVDYKALYKKLQKKCAAQETLITALKEELAKLKK